MINQIRYIISEGYNPYYNIALEAQLLEVVPEDSCILYLWQNQHTVVIGKNQNAWKECKVQALGQAGGFLARRLSGGGAVYHDLGNLNFTFIVNKEDYSVERQLEVILQALKSLGIRAEKSGRNDITVEGKKFSGNAFYNNGVNAYHHGTLLIDAELAKMSQYLNVSMDKLTSKGVESVKARVTNLKPFCPELGIEKMKVALIKAFGEVYGLQPQALDPNTIDTEVLKTLQDQFGSWEWKYGKKIAFEYELYHRFAWGDFTLQLEMNEGKVLKAVVYSDAMDSELIGAIPDFLIGSIFSSEALAAGLVPIENGSPIIKDIQQLIREQGF